MALEELGTNPRGEQDVSAKNDYISAKKQDVSAKKETSLPKRPVPGENRGGRK